MLALPPSCMVPLWDCPSAAPSLNRMASASGLPTILRVAQVFVSPYPPKLRQNDEAPRALPRCSSLMTMQLRVRPRTQSDQGNSEEKRHTVGLPFGGTARFEKTCARLCNRAGGELEQIQFMLGHVSVQTTERYLG